MTIDLNSAKQAPTADHPLNESLVTPVKQVDELLTIPEPSKVQVQTQEESRVESPVPNNTNISYFDPNAISTPAKPNFNNIVSPALQTQQQSFNSFNSTLLSVNESSTQNTPSYSVNAYSFSPLQQDNVPIYVLTHTNSSVSPENCKLATNATTSSTQSNSNEMQHLKHQVVTGSTPKRPGCRSKRSRFKRATYKELEHLNPYAIEPQVSSIYK